jgi:hypothetical protein
MEYDTEISYVVGNPFNDVALLPVRGDPSIRMQIPTVHNHLRGIDHYRILNVVSKCKPTKLKLEMVEVQKYWLEVMILFFKK